MNSAEVAQSIAAELRRATPMLFEQFKLIKESPDGVDKLRELILQVAARGKLVRQEAAEGNARELLDEIKKERDRLIKAKAVRKQNKLMPINSKAMLHHLPSGWVWTRLGVVVDYNGRDKVKSEDIGKEDWLLDLKDIDKHTSRLLERSFFKDSPSKSTKTRFFAGDVLYGKLRPYLNKVIVADEDGYCTTEIVPLRIYHRVNPHFLKYLLRRPDFLNHVNELTYGINLPRLGTDDARNVPIPLPPLAEQRRIVAKVDMLMEMCDSLETSLERERELRAASSRSCLLSLTSPSASDGANRANGKAAKGSRKAGGADSQLRKAWQRLCDHFEVLFDVPETLADLRQSILQLAVQGNLVPQDPSEEPADVLRARTIASKRRLLKNYCLRGGRALTDGITNEVPFDLPKNWAWMRLGEFGGFFGGGTPSKNNSEYWGGDIPWVTPKDMKRSYIEDAIDHVTQVGVDKSSAKLIPPKSLLMVVRGMILAHSFPVAISQCQLTINQDMKALALADTELADYLLLTCQASRDRMLKSVLRSSHGTCRIGSDDLENFVVGLPPLAEQKRIVSKASSLQSSCDELERTQANRQSTARHLITTAIHHLLSNVSVQVVNT